MSLAEKAKAKPARFTDLVVWLEALPKTEREGALYMLSNPNKWTVQDLVIEFRADALAERGEELVIGEKQFYRWRKANGVTR